MLLRPNEKTPSVAVFAMDMLLFYIGVTREAIKYRMLWALDVYAKCSRYVFFAHVESPFSPVPATAGSGG